MLRRVQLIRTQPIGDSQRAGAGFVKMRPARRVCGRLARILRYVDSAVGARRRRAPTGRRQVSTDLSSWTAGCDGVPAGKRQTLQGNRQHRGLTASLFSVIMFGNDTGNDAGIIAEGATPLASYARITCRSHNPGCCARRRRVGLDCLACTERKRRCCARDSGDGAPGH